MTNEETGPWGPPSLVIDTDAYAGNFERELCAACTGHHDDTSVTAKEIAASYDGPDLGFIEGGDGDEVDDVEGLIGTYNDNGCYRHAGIYQTPGTTEYRSVRIVLNRDPTPAELDGIMRRAMAFAGVGAQSDRGHEVQPFKIIGVRLIRERTTTQVTHLEMGR